MKRPELVPGPDRVWIESIVTVRPGGPSIPQDVEFMVPVTPNDYPRLNFSVYTGVRHHVTGLLTAYVENGLMAPVHRQIQFPEFLDRVTGAFDVNGKWPTPFPPSLYGHHRILLDLWAVDPSGAPLPAELQTTPPDTRKFVRAVGASAILSVHPGCRSSGGLEWSSLDDFTVTPDTVDLDPTGHFVAANQKVTVTWKCSDPGFPPTQYGYPGSWSGVRITGLWPDPYGVDSPQLADKVEANLGGMPYTPGHRIGIFENSTNGCDFPARAIQLKGNVPAPAPTIGPPNLTVWSKEIDPNPLRVNAVAKFVFEIKNIGGTRSRPCLAWMRLDGAVTPAVFQIDDLDPGESARLSYIFSSDYLARGNHIVTVELDPGNVAGEASLGRTDNSDYFQTYVV